MLKLPRPERNGKHFVSYCNKRNKSDNDYSIAQAVFRHMGDILPLSQEQLAEAADISRQWLAQVEAPGLVSPLSIETLFCIADALGVEPAALLDFSR